MAESFTNWIKRDGSTQFKPEKGRYHLYVSYSCPFASRVTFIRALKGLENVISMEIVNPILDPPQSWSFEQSTQFPEVKGDKVNGCSFLKELYLRVDPNFKGRITVPVLWDLKTQTIVNNESSQILRMINDEFNEFATRNVELNLYPTNLQSKIDQLDSWISPQVLQGVYRCGLAENQSDYDKAVTTLFDALGKIEVILSKSKFLCGDHLTEIDIKLFTCLIRFDVVYYVLFKCSLRHIYQFPNLFEYVCGIYQSDLTRTTVKFDYIIHGYFGSFTQINPHKIVPIGPNPKDLEFERLSKRRFDKTAESFPVT